MSIPSDGCGSINLKGKKILWKIGIKSSNDAYQSFEVWCKLHTHR